MDFLQGYGIVAIMAIVAVALLVLKHSRTRAEEADRRTTTPTEEEVAGAAPTRSQTKERPSERE